MSGIQVRKEEGNKEERQLGRMGGSLDIQQQCPENF